ncbi:hypothetical protein CgunFtcFv8_010553 [Champsocephalus gunnari]|uniref:Uncharacterized protein n=1 Tax=Champsocephalus gunnari TaxID=52237 RepID=A0AAN8HUP5_CHAGU|nr:hypothetical protein CgunFtcFv8_010553 [Champsocephalus gunnari]
MVKAVQGLSQVVVQVEEEFLDESHFYQDMDRWRLVLNLLNMAKEQAEEAQFQVEQDSHFLVLVPAMVGMDLGLESNHQSMEFQEEPGQGLYQELEECQQVPVIYQEADNTLLPQKLLNMEFKEELEWGSYQEQEEYQQVPATYKVDNTLLPQKLLNTEFKEELEWGSYQEQEEYQQVLEEQLEQA